MSLVKCPECEKEVSNKTFKCANCGFILNKPKRGKLGIVFHFIFLAFNAVMFLLLVSTLMLPTTDTEGSTIGTSIGLYIVVWLLVSLSLGLISYLTRPKANE